MLNGKSRIHAFACVHVLHVYIPHVGWCVHRICIVCVDDIESMWNACRAHEMPIPVASPHSVDRAFFIMQIEGEFKVRHFRAIIIKKPATT